MGRKRIKNAEFEKRGKSDVIKWDVFHVTDGQAIRITFEEMKSEWRQGIWLKTDQGITVNGQACPSVVLWYDTAPREVECVCSTADGCLSVYNVWDARDGKGRQSQAWSSGMVVEDLANGRRYRCNDIGFETNFDKIVFRIEVLDFHA